LAACAARAPYARRLGAAGGTGAAAAAPPLSAPAAAGTAVWFSAMNLRTSSATSGLRRRTALSALQHT
jgi:hypothetical protein